MKAMIFAAGLGTRLRPITDSRPKALIEINGVTLLERAILHLRGAGVDEIMVNAHHFAEQIAAFLRAKNNFGLRVEVSYEDVLLDTGGGLKKAAWFFDDGRPFFVHNADVISQLDLARMYRFHMEHNALATLAVKPRATKRQLMFDEGGRLCGRQEVLTAGSDAISENTPLKGGQGGVIAASPSNQHLEDNVVASLRNTSSANAQMIPSDTPLKGGIVGGASFEAENAHNDSPLEGGQGGVIAAAHNNHNLASTAIAALRNTSSANVQTIPSDTPLKGGIVGSPPQRGIVELAFDGIHVISPALLAMLEEEGTFSIIAAYLRLAAAGERILAFRSDEYYWRDVGKLAELEAIAAELA